jgi:Zn-dependent oligopeptidase
LRGIGDFVLENGFVDLVKKRNQMAKALGYLDFYDYKVTQAEGFGKLELFEMLDTLEEGTRPLVGKASAHLEKEHGKAALDPWNTGYFF